MVCQCFPSSTCHQLGQIPIFGPDWNAHVQQEHHHTNFSGLRLVFRRFFIVLAGILRCPLTSVHFKHLGIVWVVADRHDELMLQPDFHILYIYTHLEPEPRCRKIKGTTFFPAKKVTTMIKREHFLKKGSKICCCFCHILKLYQGGTRSQSEAPKHEKSQQ